MFADPADHDYHLSPGPPPAPCNRGIYLLRVIVPVDTPCTRQSRIE